MPEVQYKVDLPAFTGRNVPIKEIAKAMGKDAQYVRVGIQQAMSFSQRRRNEPVGDKAVEISIQLQCRVNERLSFMLQTRQKDRLRICLSKSYNDKDVYAARYMKYRGFRKWAV